MARAAGAAVTALNAFRKAVVEGAETQLSAQRKYAEVSASMASVMAEFDIKQMWRDMDKGQRQSGSAKYLADAADRNKEVNKEREVFLERAKNYVYGGLTNAWAWMKEQLPPVFKAANKYLGEGKPEDRDATAWDFAKAMADQYQKQKEEGKSRMDEVRQHDEEQRRKRGGQ